MSEDQSQANGGTSDSSRPAVQGGGAGMEKTPADSNTQQNISGSLGSSVTSIMSKPDLMGQKPGGHEKILGQLRDEQGIEGVRNELIPHLLAKVTLF